MTAEQPTPAPSRRPPTWLGGLVVCVVVAAVAAAAVLGMGADRPSNAASATGLDAAPLELHTVSDQIAAHYDAAAEHPEVYAEIPCYCGCEEFLAHRHLLDCFVRSDGAGWEAHAAKCGICIAESDTVRQLLADGVAPQAIRDQVMDQFGVTTPTTPDQTARGTST